MYCREQFLKCPPDRNPKEIKVPETFDKKGTKPRKNKKNKKSLLDDSSDWVTDNEGEEDKILRRRKKELRAIYDPIEKIARDIFESQTEEVKKVILSLYEARVKQKKASREKKLPKSAPLILKRKKKHFRGKKKNKSFFTAVPGALQNNRKILARIQRRRRCRGKPRSNKKRKKFPRRRRRVNGKKGNRQGRKRFFRAQKLFNKGIFVTSRKVLDEVWKAVKDPNSTAFSFCNNNIHALSKAHRKQIDLYESIENDLSRLDTVREERAKAAMERQAKEEEKEILRQGLKNKLEIRAAARAERDALRKERRAARKARALEKKKRKEIAKAMEVKE